MSNWCRTANLVLYEDLFTIKHRKSWALKEELTSQTKEIPCLPSSLYLSDNGSTPLLFSLLGGPPYITSDVMISVLPLEQTVPNVISREYLDMKPMDKADDEVKPRMRLPSILAYRRSQAGVCHRQA